MSDVKIREKEGVRYLPKTADAIFKYKDEIAFLAKTNTEGSVEITVEKTDKRGGADNQIIGTVFSNKAVAVSFTAVDWQPEFLAAQEGKTIEIGKQTYTSPALSLRVADDKSVTLDKKPADGKVHIRYNGAFNTFTVEDDLKVDLSAIGVQAGECVTGVAIFEGAGKRINIGAQSTPLVGELVMTTPIFEGTKGEVGRAEYDFPKFQFDGNFTQTFSADANYQLKGTAISTDSTTCGEGASYGDYKEVIYDEDEIMNFSKLAASPSVVEIAVGQKATINVFGSKGGMYDKIAVAPGDDLAFASESAATATVTATGEITGVAEGETTVTATYKGLTAKVSVTVTATV